METVLYIAAVWWTVGVVFFTMFWLADFLFYKFKRGAAWSDMFTGYSFIEHSVLSLLGPLWIILGPISLYVYHIKK